MLIKSALAGDFSVLNPQQHPESSTDSVTKTGSCNHRNCKCCEMMGRDDSYIIDELKIRPAPGTCSSYNVVYIFICKFGRSRENVVSVDN